MKDLKNIRNRALAVKCAIARKEALVNIEHAMLTRKKGWHTTSRTFFLLAVAAIAAGA